MPELPEVETTRRGLLPHVKGRSVTKVVVRNARLRWPVSEEVRQLHSAPLLSLGRRGKYLQFNFADGQMLVHLGMSGSVRVLPSEVPAEKHDHVDWVLDDGNCLRLNDPRRFGSVLWNTQGDNHKLLAHLGVEPLAPTFDGEYLAQQAKGRRVAVKPFLMNADIVVGVGNIYAQESLFLAGVNPTRSVSRIGLANWQRLASTVKSVLENALIAGGTSLRDFTHTDGKPGYFQQQLNVYGRGGKPCVNCGQLLKQIRQGQRTTCYCTHCQH